MPESLTGPIERVTFHNPDTGFAVLRVRVRGRRDLVTVTGRVTAVSAGEHLEASGRWVLDREHGRQFKADAVSTAAPATAEGIERYLGPGTVLGIGRQGSQPFEQPNGLVGTPDGKTLYVADSGAGKTYAYDVAADGSLGGKRLFCKEGSDGMTLDAEGRVYLTGKGVAGYDADGRLVERVAVPEPWTANVCFGGEGHATLFVTAGAGLYTLKTRTRGAARQ